MEINYKIRRGDLWNFVFFESIKSRSLWILIIILVGLITYVNIADLEDGESISDAIPIIVIVCLMMILIMLLLILIQAFLRSLSRKHRALLTEHKLIVTDTGFSSESEYGRSDLSWHLIQTIKITRNYILLYIGLQSAIIIPKRILGSKSDQEAFIEHINTRWIKSKTS